METLENLIKELEKNKDKYSASFDPKTGKVISVGPSVSFQQEKNKIDLDKDIAESILTAEIKISNCFVDLTSGNLEITELKNITKIDDVLHRIPLIEYSDINDCDLFITLKEKNKKIVFQLAKKFGGTRKTKKNNQRKIHWNGDTVMNFYVTAYNDPHWILEHFEFSISDLTNKNKTFCIENLPAKFSIYTRRILKNYSMEMK